MTPAVLPAAATAAAPRGGRDASPATGCEVAEASKEQAADWDAFVAGHPDGTVEHLWAWHDVFARVFRHRPAFLIARRGGEVAGVLPLALVRSALIGRAAISLPFFNYAGIVARDADSARALRDAAAQRARAFGARYLELRHRQRQFEDWPVRSNKVGVALDLPTRADVLWTALDRKVRNQVRKAQKDGLAVGAGDSALLPEFYDVFARNMRDLGTPVFPRGLFTETLRQFPERARVFLVRRGSQCIAGGIALRLGETVLVPWASALKEFRPLCGNMLLYWSMLEWSIEAGARTFDFGRSSPGGGTHAFKLQWGARQQPLFTEYGLVTDAAVPSTGADSPRFRRATEAWRRLPLGLANLLGPAVIRHVS